ncbi:TPA: hypothetical protein KO307_004010, partial [Clostridioides difficile]|nr:hypothetical protein [Clostridioides difficile]HBG2133767.1 hypothetical protein [Clostridioides difficile]
CYKIGDIFEIRKVDQESMEEKGYIEVIGEAEEKNNIDNEILNKDGE